MTVPPSYPLRPFLPGDTMALRDLFAASIEELTQDDYDEEQRIAWASRAAEAEDFMRHLAGMTTLVVEVDGEHIGFASLKNNNQLDMLYVHPYYAGQGVGTTLTEALERIAKGRGATDITVEASETAVLFFEARGYVAQSRNSVPVEDLRLTNTTMKKVLVAASETPVETNE